MERNICPHCSKEVFIRSQDVYTPETFKEAFNVGDRVSAWATDKVVIISAIGKCRFFAINEEDVDLVPKNTRVNKIEHPYSMFNTWRKV